MEVNVAEDNINNDVKSREIVIEEHIAQSMRLMTQKLWVIGLQSLFIGIVKFYCGSYWIHGEVVEIWGIFWVVSTVLKTSSKVL